MSDFEYAKKRKVRNELNNKHRFYPQVGDYWREMFHGILVVIGVTRENVMFCSTKKTLDKKHWTWDLTRLTTLTRDEFADKVCYKSDNNECWCDVKPKAQVWARADAIKLMFGEGVDCE